MKLRNIQNLITKLTMAHLPGGTAGDAILTAGPRAGALKEKPRTTIPIFIHPKALTFPAVVGLVKGAWAGATLLPVPWLGSVWFPFLLSMALGLLIAASNLSEQKVKGLTRVLGFGIGFVNSLVVFAAVIGIPGGRP